jgi:hypothetical protein
MTMLNILRCDVCGRDQEIRPRDPADQANGWGVLHVGGGKRDLCPVCVGQRTLTTPVPVTKRSPDLTMAKGSHLRAG